MTARPIESAPGLRSDVERARLEGARASSFPYRLDVAASDVADVVGSVGGWLFDRARDGWEVTAFLPEDCDPRPLRILGVKTLSLEDWIGCDDRRPHALAVAADVVSGNSLARKAVFAALESGVTQVSVWGAKRSCSLAQRIDDVQHQLSAAAKAFKSQAVAASSIQRDWADSAGASAIGVQPYPAPRK